jgi:phosphate acetyltransferase
MKTTEICHTTSDASIPRVLFPEHANKEIVRAAESMAKKKLIQAVFIKPPSRASSLFEVFNEQDESLAWRITAIDHLVMEAGIDEINLSDLNLSAALLKVGYVDLVVLGAEFSSSEVIKAGLKVLGLSKNTKTLSSSFLMSLPDRILTFADCAVIPDPTAEQLADIAISSANFHQRVTGMTPVVAMLSFSTKGSSNHKLLDTIREGLSLARQKQADLIIDGELQLDAAIIPSVAKRKLSGSLVAGRANVLVFPDLNSANIACKITQYLADARAIGPFLHGLSKPWLDLSRGSCMQEIVDTTLVACSLLNNANETVSQKIHLKEILCQ